MSGDSSCQLSKDANMNRILIGMALMGISANVCAVSYLGEAHAPSGYYLGVTGYYLQPQVSGYDTAYGYLQSPNATNNATSFMRQVNTTYHGAWGLNASYVFCNFFDISGDYFQYYPGNDWANTHVSINQTFNTDNPNQALSIGANSTITGKAGYRINQADLTIGETFVKAYTTFHPSVGVRWANVTRFLKTSAFIADDTLIVDPTPFPSVVEDISERSYFNGLGPIVGIDATYWFKCGWQFVVHADGALLVGRINTNNTVFTSATSPLGTTGLAESSWDSDTVGRIVPVADIKVAGAYDYHLNPCYSARVEVGYQASHYWRSIDRTFGSAVVNNAGNAIIANINGQNTTSGVGLQGPYANITFNVA